MNQLRPPSTALLDKYTGRDFLPLYHAMVTVSGGDTGHGRASGIVCSHEGDLAVDLRMPKELDGPGGAPNPEQLFAAGYAACFHGAMYLLATRAGIRIVDARVEAHVEFGRDPVDGLYMLTAELRVHLPGMDAAIAEELIHQTERVCPYSKMVRQGIRHVTRLAD
ncbi:Ohr family peroxiredoxin [Cupriavidus plantarum]|uniref:Ohr subfamily peroxiredoxin n=1 Tax=Cupriavidus plantarum TaxID=942865 RepID=A0A316FCJ5_9BURK|nr:Ohr family peroxiredoxin [Cupriavidus plantarum]NYI00690.1 Ohr subfamily peroxiredoxin [Cupriavidus plantarum]PWK35100.1 Ohr subfamily peroxiredoxin [Cupriavidus plantarum]REE93548.1 Ohr subfamily peroxiredoxin [Cupriavidus plantarum]RLK38970.1 Ohr subfamily peroxiredoxin [Cupriavidus plantarum]CAG2136174.1 Organic hydroperoxide resistance protein OhrB [Cupriavidus plantarum]